MRISNINQYLGGADNVIAQEILVGNSFSKTINASGIDFSSATFDVDAELFKATIAPRGSSITITSLTAPNGDPLTTSASRVSRSLTGAIANQANGSFDLTIPSDLLSGFSGGPYNPIPDATNPFVVAMKVQWTIGSEVRSIRFLWVVRYQPNIT